MIIFFFQLLAALTISEEEKTAIKISNMTKNHHMRVCLIKKISPWFSSNGEKKILSNFFNSVPIPQYFYREISDITGHDWALKKFRLHTISDWELINSGKEMLPVSLSGELDLTPFNLKNGWKATRKVFIKKATSLSLFFFPENDLEVEISGKRFKSAIPFKLEVKLSSGNHFITVTSYTPDSVIVLTDNKSVFSIQEKKGTPFSIATALIKTSPYHKHALCSWKFWRDYSNLLKIKRKSDYNLTSVKSVRKESYFSNLEILEFLESWDFSFRKYLFNEQIFPDGAEAEISKLFYMENAGWCLSVLKNIKKMRQKYGDLPGILMNKVRLAENCNTSSLESAQKLVLLKPFISTNWIILSRSLAWNNFEKRMDVLWKGYQHTGSFSLLIEMLDIEKNIPGLLSKKTGKGFKYSKHLKKTPKILTEKGVCQGIDCTETDNIFRDFLQSRRKTIKIQNITESTILTDEQIIVIRPDGTVSYMQYRMVFKGKEYSSNSGVQSVRYSPATQFVTVLENRIIHKNGKISSDPAKQTMYEVHDAASRMFYDIRELNYNFNPLTFEDKYEFAYRVDGLAAAHTLGNLGFGGVYLFQDHRPRKLSAITVYYTDKNMKFASSVKTTETKGKKGRFFFRRFELKNVPGVSLEKGMPGWGETVSYLQLGTAKDWESVSADYHRFIKSKYKITSAVRSLSRNIVGDAKTPQEKIVRIHRWIQQNIRYVSLMFGLHSYLPYGFQEIIQRKFGDCKDMTLVMVMLLNSAGIRAYPAAVRTRGMGHFRYDVPSLAPFDHSIVYLPDTKQWLDTTVKGLLYPALPEWIKGRSAIIIKPSGGNLSKIPEDNWTLNKSLMEVEINLNKKHLSEFKIKNTVRGQGEIWLRESVLKGSLRKQWVGYLPDLKIKSFISENMNTLNSPFRYTLQGKSVSFLRKEKDGSKTIDLSLMDVQILSALKTSPGRKNDLLLRFAGSLHRKITLTYPTDLCPSDRVHNIKIKGNVFDFKSDYVWSKNKIIIERVIVLKKSRILINELPTFLDSINKAIIYLNRKFSFRKCLSKPAVT
ncbi:DUF3857 and transglutaminase domain-containing protein [Myxococcota bacterium]|nr:DUF3857 and transglutaminase domain-containing protein [Myxococcota bacterium]MBU1379548.1 DUF3857 and transglutaminase domain-containing protein [Myxococcota bacterium]MBU1495266.1 DUF3857 and transglutaminase domain-containing protein [Myxococcota bacterium]